MSNVNLLKEVVHVMNMHHKTWNDVSWIGSEDFSITIDQFIEAAEKTDYCCGYGHEEVAVDLVICFKDGSWLSRRSYDGSEWFTYNAYPQKPQTRFVGKVKLADLDGYGALSGLKRLNS